MFFVHYCPDQHLTWFACLTREEVQSYMQARYDENRTEKDPKEVNMMYKIVNFVWREGQFQDEWPIELLAAKR